MIEWFRAGGFSMYIILFVFLIADAVAMIHVARPKPITLRIAVALLVLVLASGVVGSLIGRQQVMRAIEGVSPDQRAAIEEAGMMEAGVPIRFGAILAAIAAVPLGLAEFRRRRA